MLKFLLILSLLKDLKYFSNYQICHGVIGSAMVMDQSMAGHGVMVIWFQLGIVRQFFHKI